ncbi:DUF1217 domain-containing protein [Salipiger sp.]|uniref:DUF1217 domain-containing protein n=1 Tax=Salipiger sp. TaxID=2078585 RepID=UPI003A97EE68
MTFSPTTLGTGIAGYNFLLRTRATQQAALANSPQVARDTEHFREKLKDIQTSDQLMEDRAMLRVALGAFGLEDDLDNKAFIKKILDSDLADSKSLANRLADKRYLAFAKAFNFAGESGPQLPDGKSAEDVTRDLAAIRTADDLLGNTSLLRATLKTFDLEGDIGNTFFLKKVLESDPTDPASFARRLADPRYAELAEAFDLSDKVKDRNTVYGFASVFADAAATLETPEDLLEDETLLTEALRVFGLENDVYRPDFLDSVLRSNLNDSTSFANQLEDKRYAALAGVFDFHEMAQAALVEEPFTSTLQSFVTTLNARSEPVTTSNDFFSDIKLMLETYKFFGLPSRSNQAGYVNRILNSDRSDPAAMIHGVTDGRYLALADAFRIEEPNTDRIYPPEFADQVVTNYLDRQFEISIGESDESMRVALSMERDLGKVIGNAKGNDSRWYGVMASNLLREVFETVFQLPDSFGTLDVDRQLKELKHRSESYFGTSALEDFTDPDRMEDLRRRYLMQSNLQSSATSSSASIVLSLLSRG